jgi:hypothetical protein
MIPEQGQENPQVPDEYRDFNHYYNIELCVMNCINRSSNQVEYIAAVNQFEATLISDIDDALMKKLRALDDAAEKELGAQVNKLNVQFNIAREKYRLLYGFMKKRGAVKAVLAIGRPKCHNCGELIRWDRESEEKEVEVHD